MKHLITISTLLASCLLALQQAIPMPMFARKHQFDCAVCHAAVPRLNVTGYRYKAAGYRMPYEIGQVQAADLQKLQNYVAFIGILNGQFGQVTPAGQPAQSDTMQMSAQELDVHPLTGSWNEHWGSGFEVDTLPNGSVSLNQAFVTYQFGQSEWYGTIQAGLIPNFLGYALWDRPVAVTVPLVLQQAAGNASFNTKFSLANPRAAGISANTFWGNTNLSVSVRNRLTSPPNGTLDSQNSPSANPHMGDVLASATLFLDEMRGSGSAVQLYYYNGVSTIPTPAGSTLTMYSNAFQRLGTTVNYYVTPAVNVYGGVSWGQDANFQITSNTTGGVLLSQGYFVGAEYFASGTLMGGLRIENMVGQKNTPYTATAAGTLYLNWRIIQQVIMSTEYQYSSAQINAPSSSSGQNTSTLTLQGLLAF